MVLGVTVRIPVLLTCKEVQLAVPEAAAQTNRFPGSLTGAGCGIAVPALPRLLTYVPVALCPQHVARPRPSQASARGAGVGVAWRDGPHDAAAAAGRDGGGGRGAGAGCVADARSARRQRHHPSRPQEAQGARLPHGRGGGARDAQGALGDQGPLRPEGGQAASVCAQDGRHGLLLRLRDTPAAARDRPPHDRVQGPRRAAARRHRDRFHHRDLRRVSYGQDAALPHAVRDDPAASRAGRR